MATVDTETVLSRARLVADASAVWTAIIEGDMEEARFRAQLIRNQATDMGLEAVADAALMVFILLPPDTKLPKRGIGKAMLRLRGALGIAP